MKRPINRYQPRQLQKDSTLLISSLFFSRVFNQTHQSDHSLHVGLIWSIRLSILLMESLFGTQATLSVDVKDCVLHTGKA